ncbi:MAG: hypothetical protein MHM6MM_002695 [Cercozoa sp. M6MM]
MEYKLSKTTVYIGGLEASVREPILQATFITFGEVTHVSIPRDADTAEHRGYGFVDFAEEEDAKAAIDNMNGAELLGRVMRVAPAREQEFDERTRALWDSDAYFKKLDEKKKMATDEDSLRLKTAMDLEKARKQQPVGPGIVGQTQEYLGQQ